jgi:hypothetical protein
MTKKQVAFVAMFFAVTLLGACRIDWKQKPPKPAVYRELAGAPRFAAVPEDSVAIHYLDTPGELPAGVLPPPPKPRPRDTLDYVVLEPSYPTPEAPHHKLGALRVHSNDVPDGKQLAAFLASEAGRHGANAIVITSYRLGAVHTAVALRLSDAAPRPFEPAETLLARAPEQLAGYVPVSDVTRDLARFEPLLIEGKRGTCYAIHFALHETAELDASVRGWLRIQNDHAGGAGSMPLGDSEIGKDVPVGLRQHANVLGCPTSDRSLRVRFMGGKRTGDGFSYGRGSLYVKIYSRPIDEAELDRLSKQVEQRVSAHERRVEEHRAAVLRDCNACQRELRHCPHLTEDRCEPYKRCLMVRARQTQDCR